MANKMDIPQAHHATQPRYGFDYVEVLGARTHNLKNIDVTFPRNQLVIITGVSGSGKSSLAFDTINAEGQRRYRESFSAYARSFLGSLTRPEVDKINGLSPVIAIEQKTTHRNARSTVGTTTEIYDFMRLLFARVADAYAHTTGNKMVTQDEAQIVAHLLRTFSGQRVTLMAPLVKGRKGHHETLLKRFINLGFNKIRVNGVMVELTDRLQLARHKKHDIALIIDHMRIDPKIVDRIKNGLALALQHGKGTLLVVDTAQKDYYFSTCLVDEETGLAYGPPEPSLFSFNTPYGACPTCDGLGETTQIDIDRLIPDKSLSIQNGAILPLGPYKTSLLFKKITALLKFFQCQISDPVEVLPPAVLNLLLFGNVTKYRSGVVANCVEPFEGIITALIKQQERETATRHGSPEEGLIYTIICPDCKGTRLNPIARSFKIKDKSIADLVSMDLDRLKKWFATLSTALTHKQQIIANEIIKEITKRLQFLIDVGLHYLHLNRSLSTLSGGEAQRIRLATQIGAQLLEVLYILDEPSIGLHQRDNGRLIHALKRLRDIGNTILVVEHDKDIMLAADYLIEIGPRAGICGGEVVAAGSLESFLAQPSATAEFLTNKRRFLFSSDRKKGNGKTLTITGCSGNNLKNVTLTIPLGLMICVTGVSGSGKSSLVRKTLLPIVKKQLYNSQVMPLPYIEATGLLHINKVIEVSQSPIGRTPRSNPSTYTGMFVDIRNFFAILPEAKIRGYKPGRFSFNLKEGRCNTCEGAGIQRIEMGFLPEVYVTCDNCKGKRYNRETLEIQYKSKSIADVLDMTVSNAIPFFESHPSILVKLRTLEEVGLGYITLGQHATTLSGGEAQRVKLATELAKKSTGDTLYILDEPSTGLHFQDIVALLSVLKKLVDHGNTVLIIEHNIDIIKVADYVIDIGPDGGRDGGYLIAEGTPEAVARVPESHTGYFLKKELKL
ncbi:excinuclease ABC subunit UvrA [Candidatus Cardinium hertigii]|uniref:excinuclease ABC subunit UvrA n=1 Tax=Candidatus Cardinium hertigii TaxID=247481 RepID=UPI003D7D8F39